MLPCLCLLPYLVSGGQSLSASLPVSAGQGLPASLPMSAPLPVSASLPVSVGQGWIWPRSGS
jgi:hypothetical protein